jgi:putative transposase
MPRKPRIYMADVPCHIIQRGNNRQACFFAEQDYQFYLECLTDACERYHVDLHAYVLMTNHVHLLMTPDKADGISRVMQSLGRRYVQYINFEYRRSGTLWEGRHKASLIDAEDYLLKCYRYIEMNPVRAGMVEHPGDYQWSSYRANAYGQRCQLLKPHSLYLAISGQSEERLTSYRALFSTDMDQQDIHAIRRAIQFAVPLGSCRFREQIEQGLNVRFGQVKRGRPRVEDEMAIYSY